MRSSDIQRRRRLDILVRGGTTIGAAHREWRHSVHNVSSNLSDHGRATKFSRYEKTIETLDVLDPEKKYI